jgi:hypothetical protein
MKPDTPLTEVAHHLPLDAALRLSKERGEIQTAVLAQIRTVVVFWETSRYVFDPVAYEGILDALVATLIPLYQTITAGRAEAVALREETELLRSALMEARLLNDSLNSTLATMQSFDPGAPRD